MTLAEVAYVDGDGLHVLQIAADAVEQSRAQGWMVWSDFAEPDYQPSARAQPDGDDGA